MSSSYPVVVIVGRPNVGKSTLFNRIIKRRAAVVEDTPGITRDRLYAEANWQGKTFTVVDTGGIVFGEDDPLAVQIRVQANIALDEADVVIFLVDAESGVHPDDIDLANALRGITKPVYLVANKADNNKRDQYVNEFFRLGVGDELFPVSALHGRGVADMLDKIVEVLPPTVVEEDHREEARLAIIGRPNVGKSSMVNAFTGEQRMIVSDIAGTTRDAIDTELEYKNEKFRLIDTAGIRRRGKIQGTVEYYMVDRAQRAIERAEVAIVIVDGKEGLTDGDKRIAKIAFDAGKACVFVVNKWDLMEPDAQVTKKQSMLQKDFTRIIRDELPELSYASVVFTSAKEGQGLWPVLDSALEALESFSTRIQTGPLNRLIAEAVFDRPYASKGRAFKIYYATQVLTRPPTFSMFCNDPELAHFSYQRYLINKIRDAYPMPGTPIRLQLKASHKDKTGAPRTPGPAGKPWRKPIPKAEKVKK